MIDIITSNMDSLAVIGTALVTIASALANMIPKKTFLGKIFHAIALNFKVDK